MMAMASGLVGAVAAVGPQVADEADLGSKVSSTCLAGMGRRCRCGSAGSSGFPERTFPLSFRGSSGLCSTGSLGNFAAPGSTILGIMHPCLGADTKTSEGCLQGVLSAFLLASNFSLPSSEFSI